MPIRVMLVDDAIVVRHVLTDSLSKDPEIEIAGTAADGVIACDKIAEMNPDVVVLDVEMPNRDGIETLAYIRQNHPNVKVIMFSTLTSRGASATIDAMLLGADDYSTKPSNTGSMAQAVDVINAELLPKIKGLYASTRTTAARSASLTGRTAVGKFRVDKPGSTNATSSRTAARPLPPRPAVPPVPPVKASTIRPASKAASASTPTPARTASSKSTEPVKILTIAVSTGGPNALNELLPQLPANLSVPVVIVQHIPPVFSKALATRLDVKCALRVKEGEEGDTLEPGTVWIAPGDYHMVVKRAAAGVKIALNQGPPENSCRPAADVLFRSVADAYGSSTLGLVLTGMGSDGLKGARQIVDAGGRIIAQDEASSVVWGMPGAVADAGLCDAVLPLNQIAAELMHRIGSARTAGQSSITPSRH